MIATVFHTILKRTKPSSLRFLSCEVSRKISPREYKEVEISVPWGKLAGKHWGPTDVPPIIALHGWQDNSASFDPLMSYLPEDISVFALDLPGHGYSSWIPNGLMYNFLHYFDAIERVKQYYKMDKIGLIGHSMGGMISFEYGCTFSDRIKFIVALDFFKVKSGNPTKHRNRFAKDSDSFYELEKKLGTVATPRHKEADAIKRSIEAMESSLNEASCKILYTRGVTKYPDGTVSFNRDPRLKFLTMIDAYTHEDLKTLAKRIKFPYRILKAEYHHFNEPREFFFDIMRIIESKSNDFEFHMFPGRHHFHMDKPELVAEILTPFIEKYQ